MLCLFLINWCLVFVDVKSESKGVLLCMKLRRILNLMNLSERGRGRGRERKGIREGGEAIVSYLFVVRGFLFLFCFIHFFVWYCSLPFGACIK